jgi:hypothetical protein
MRIINGDQWDIIHRPVRSTDPVLEHVADQAAAAARAAVVPAGSIITVTGTGAQFSVGGNGLLGGGIQALRQRVTFDEFTDGGSTVGTFVLTGTIPVGAVALRTTVTDVVGFAGDTSAVLTVGDGSDVDRYMTGTLNVFANVTALDGGAISGTDIHTTAISTVTLTVTSASDFTGVDAGALTVNLFYLL